MRFLIPNHGTDRFRQEICLRGLNLEFGNFQLADIVKYAQGDTVALYKDCIKAQSRLSIRSEKKKKSEEAAFKLYLNQGEQRNSDYWISLTWA